MSLQRQLSSALEQRKKNHLYRYRRVLESAQGPNICVDGKKLTAFCSNDYLSLANHPQVVAAFRCAANQFGVGSGASHLVNGHNCEHHALEEELADFTRRDRCLLFSSGYMANLGVITALASRGDAVFEDRFNHASLLDGGLLSGARLQRFLHNDMDDLEKRVLASSAKEKLIAVDGVFSMDGDTSPLAQLAVLAQRHSARLMVDDAHGFGFFGTSGAGCAEHFDLSQQQVPILVGTLGKAFGTFGAFVVGSEALIETLIQFSRTYIYTTALPPAVAAATRASLQLVRKESWRRAHLTQLIAGFRRRAEQLGLALMPSISPIQPLVLGDEARTLAAAQFLEERGFLVGAIRPPTVPAGSARLRVTLCADHTDKQIDDLLSALHDAIQSDK